MKNIQNHTFQVKVYDKVQDLCQVQAEAIY